MFLPLFQVHLIIRRTVALYTFDFALWQDDVLFREWNLFEWAEACYFLALAYKTHRQIKCMVKKETLACYLHNSMICSFPRCNSLRGKINSVFTIKCLLRDFSRPGTVIRPGKWTALPIQANQSWGLQLSRGPYLPTGTDLEMAGLGDDTMILCVKCHFDFLNHKRLSIVLMKLDCSYSRYT